MTQVEATSLLDGDWRDDPFGRFESRHFFLGEPTSFVHDGRRQGLDPVAPLLAGATERPLFASLTPRLMLDPDRVRELAAERAPTAPPPPMLPAAPLVPPPPSIPGIDVVPSWPLDLHGDRPAAFGTTTYLPPSPWRPRSVAAPSPVPRHRRRTVAATTARHAMDIAAGAAVVVLTVTVVNILRAPLSAR